MHDDVGASLTRIAMMSDVLKKRSDVGEGAREWLGKISETSRGLMEEMNQIIWALNPKNDNLESLVTYIRRFAIEYLEPTPVRCIFDLPSDLPELSLTVEVRRNIYLVVREALHNVVKHSGATEVVISLFPSLPLSQGRGGRGVRLSIRDNGRGFDPQKLIFPGNGLVNMQKRIEDIGGKFQIISDPGEGTAIEISI
jgi:signal transduction histidine kinase